MEPTDEILTMEAVISELNYSTESDIKRLHDMGFDGTIGSLPHINTVRINPFGIWLPEPQSNITFELVGAPNSSKSIIVHTITEAYREDIVTYPTLIPVIDFLVRHYSLYQRLFPDFWNYLIYDKLNMIQAELFFAKIRENLGIPDVVIPERRTTNHPMLREQLKQLRMRLFDEQHDLIVAELKKFLEECRIRHDMSDGDKIGYFLRSLGLHQDYEFALLSLQDQELLLKAMQVIFSEIDFDFYLKRLDLLAQEEDSGHYNEILQKIFERESKLSTALHLRATQEGWCPKLSIFDEDPFSARLYYYTNVVADRLKDPRSILQYLSEEEAFWRKYKTHIERFDVYPIVEFFFAYPNQSLLREGKYRGPIMNETYLSLLYLQQLAMYSRLLHATDLPFIVIPIDATGSQEETYTYFMNCFNEVMKFARKDFRLGRVAF